MCIDTSVWRGLSRGLAARSARDAPRALSRELVAETVDGVNELRILRIALDLLTQPRDVDVDGARHRHLVVAPHFRQQLIARQRRPAMRDEMPEQLELARGQIDRAA